MFGLMQAKAEYGNERRQLNAMIRARVGRARSRDPARSRVLDTAAATCCDSKLA
jgi:hypothetical protein